MMTLACDLSAMNAEERARHAHVWQHLSAAVHEVQALDDGYAFRYAMALWPLAAEYVSRERLCCPFFTFTLQIEPNAISFWLRLTGDDAVKEFLDAEFGLS
jgi:hypothetical protein